jgi:hypothetical protein
MVGDGQVLGIASESFNGGSTVRVRIKLKGTKLRAAKRAKAVRFAAELVDASGKVLATKRTSLTRPFAA